MFHQIIYDYVAIQIPTYFEKPQRFTRHMHSLFYRQIHNHAVYYQQSFYPATIALWNKNSTQRLFSWMILTPSKKESRDQPSVPLIFKHCFSSEHLLESSFYSCTDSATAHNTRERVLQDVKIDRHSKNQYREITTAN